MPIRMDGFTAIGLKMGKPIGFRRSHNARCRVFPYRFYEKQSVFY